MRFDPDTLAPGDLEALLRELEAEVGDAHGFKLETRIVEIPVLYDDPWTNETLQKFRDRHQDPESTDLEYAARINGFPDKAAFIEAHAASPWLASMVGFVAGLPFLYQLVPRERQLEVPKYVRPRTDTPKQTVGHGGCFGCIYSVRGAGGYQMFGITPSPIYDPTQQLPDFADFVCFFEPGDIVKFEPIDRDRYDELKAEADAGRGSIRRRPVTFDFDGLLRRFRRLQRAAAGGAPCRLRSSSPGLSTTVQDLGREGYYHVGVPPSGALDQFSLVAANLLVGNEPGAAGLEARVPGAGAALHGGGHGRRLRRGHRAARERRGAGAVDVVRGDRRRRARLRPRARGRAPLHRGVRRDRRAGEARQPLDLRARRARRPRRASAAGRRRARRSGRAATAARPGRSVPEALRPDAAQGARGAGGHGPVRPPAHGRTGGGRSRDTTWTLTPVADRVGFRYRGEKLAMLEREQPFGAGSDPSNIVDAPYPIGSIQVPGGVEPIILHRDAVSGGGYAMIATVISADMDTVAQSAPGARTRFVAVDLEAALAARRERGERLRRLGGELA